MSLIYLEYISKKLARDNPETLFPFGDNYQRIGLLGQAKELRGEPNAVGIPTKKSPNAWEAAFLTNDDYETWCLNSAPDFCRLLKHQGQIIWPRRGIGTGYAQLPHRAPLIWQEIEILRKELEQRP